MAGTPLTRELYDRMVSSFRECPGNFSRCAVEVGVDRRMTTRAWRQGWERYSWARPIESLLAEETNSAKAHRASMREKAAEAAEVTRDQARDESVMARTEELRMVELSRKSVLGSLVVAMELLPSMRVLSRHVSESIQNGDLGKEGSESRAMTLISKYATLMDKVTRAADSIVKLSRLDRGAPGVVVGLGGIAVPPGAAAMSDEAMTHERAVEIVEMSADILEEVRVAGELPADLVLALSGEGGMPPGGSA